MTQTTQERNKALVAQTEEAVFPRLTSAELALVRPLAKPCDYADDDVVFRAGQPDIDLYVVGNEGAGKVLAVGDGVQNVKVGDCVVIPHGVFSWAE